MQLYNPCALYAIRVIRAVMNEAAVPPVPGDVYVQELYAFAKLHNVEALIWYGLCRLELDFTHPVLQDWENRVNMLLAQGIVQLADRDVVLEALILDCACQSFISDLLTPHRLGKCSLPSRNHLPPKTH